MSKLRSAGADELAHATTIPIHVFHFDLRMEQDPPIIGKKASSKGGKGGGEKGGGKEEQGKEERTTEGWMEAGQGREQDREAGRQAGRQDWREGWMEGERKR